MKKYSFANFAGRVDHRRMSLVLGVSLALTWLVVVPLALWRSSEASWMDGWEAGLRKRHEKPPTKVTLENYERVRAGMMAGEVDDLFGGGEFEGSWKEANGDLRKDWVCNSDPYRRVTVYFGPRGTVVDKRQAGLR